MLCEFLPLLESELQEIIVVNTIAKLRSLIMLFMVEFIYRFLKIEVTKLGNN